MEILSSILALTQVLFVSESLTYLHNSMWLETLVSYLCMKSKLNRKQLDIQHPSQVIQKAVANKEF